MIGYLQGYVIHKSTDSVMINVSGVGYEVFTHPRVLYDLQEGDAAELTIETHVREDHIHLFGFEDHAEREWFRALTNVERVGAKVALAILGTLPPQQMLTAILAKDTRAFTQVSGVGAKMGERIVMEMKDKALKLPINANITSASPTSTSTAQPIETKKAGGKKASVQPSQAHSHLIEDAASALVNLGYNRSEALTLVTQSLKEDGVSDLDSLITVSLRKAS